MRLFIDTTSQNVSLIMFDQNNIINKVEYTGNNDHTTTIYDHLTKFNLKDITEIYVTNGPGSYTGVRIGVLIAKTLSHELNCKLFAINTLKIHYLANRCPVAFDARGKKYFTYDGSDYHITKEEDIAGFKIVSEHVNCDILLNDKVLDEFELVDSLTLTIDYMKEAI